MNNDALPTHHRALRVLLSLRQQDWLALMLLGLHAALVLGINTALSKAFLLTHFGAFLLWQPVLRGEQKLYVGQALLIVLAAALLVASESWWLMSLWISILFALIGGEVPTIKNVGQRLVSLMAATYLLAILLIWVVPHLFQGEDFGELFRGGGSLRPFRTVGRNLPGPNRTHPAFAQLQRGSDLQPAAVPDGGGAGAGCFRHPAVESWQLSSCFGAGTACHRRHSASLELAVGSACRVSPA